VRVRQWQTRFEALINARMHAPFAWGSNDCCTFACEAVGAITGVNPMDAWLDKYTSQLGAAKVLKKHGGVRAIAGKNFGPFIIPFAAQVGDIGCFVEPSAEGDGQTLAVWCGSAWMCPGAKGLLIVRPEAITNAWRCHA
jgi:hypothetical protein